MRSIQSAGQRLAGAPRSLRFSACCDVGVLASLGLLVAKLTAPALRAVQVGSTASTVALPIDCLVRRAQRRERLHCAGLLSLGLCLRCLGHCLVNY